MQVRGMHVVPHPKSSQCFSLYDVMDIDENMALLVVKKQLTHFKIKKVIKEECKDSLA